jgi:hypothetical protein
MIYSTISKLSRLEFSYLLYLFGIQHYPISASPSRSEAEHIPAQTLTYAYTHFTNTSRPSALPEIPLPSTLRHQGRQESLLPLAASSLRISTSRRLCNSYTNIGFSSSATHVPHLCRTEFPGHQRKQPSNHQRTCNAGPALSHAATAQLCSSRMLLILSLFTEICSQCLRGSQCGGGGA